MKWMWFAWGVLTISHALMIYAIGNMQKTIRSIIETQEMTTQAIRALSNGLTDATASLKMLGKYTGVLKND